MHGCSLGDAPLVNAEVDSMGGVVDGRVEIGGRSSPQRAAIEKAQAELRREYDVREERRRELEFLEKGGNPLDFKFGNATSVSVQSTSLTDQRPEQLVTSEAKGSFALTASPHGDSLESSGRPEAPIVCEPNCADNLLLFDGESDFVGGERNSIRFVRSKIAPSEQASHLDGCQNARESGDSAVFGLPKSRAYKRRNRSRPNRDGTRSSSTDIVPSRGGNSKPTCSNGIMALKDLPSDGVADMVLDNGQAVESTGLTEVGLPDLVPDCNKNLLDNQDNQRLQGLAQETTEVASGLPESVGGRQLVASTRLDCPPHTDPAKAASQTGSGQQNGFCDAKRDEGSVPNEGQNSSATFTKKGLDSESSCTRNSLSLDRTTDLVPFNSLRDDDFNGNTGEQILVSSVSPGMEINAKLEATNENKADDIYNPISDEHDSVCKSHHNGSILGAGEELHGSGSGSQEEVKCSTGIDGMEADGITPSEIEIKPGNLLTDDLNPRKENGCSGRIGGSTDSSAHDKPNTQKENACNKHQDNSVPGLSQTALPFRDSSDANKQQIFPETHLKLEVKAHEDSILKEARIIEAKRKRIAQLSVGAFTSESHQKSHWDFVLEEMAWLANDFAQERLWKISAAAQLCHQIASTSRVRFEGKRLCWKQKKVAHILSKAIMEFWHSAEELSKGAEVQCSGRNSARGVLEYAVRYLKCNTSLVPLCLAEAPVTPERISDLGIPELSWEDHFTEENLFYTVPLGAMETYRKAIESHLAQVERTGSSIQEEVDTSIYDVAADNAFEEDEGETNTYLLSGDVEGGKPSRFAQKKKRNLIKSSASRSYDMGSDFPFLQRVENKFGTQQSGLIVKRPANNLHVSSIPTKRVRTASRQRFPTPFGAGTSGVIQFPNKTDASSGDTNSFQDDQSTFHGGSQIPNSMEVESVGDFEKQLPFDSAEVSKPKKKKKAKHLGSTYEQRWQLENNFQNEPRDYSRKRLDKLESNGSSGLFGQHIMKKQKMRQPLDNSLDNYSPLAGSIPSPVTSQMSNMSNSNKLIKILGGRDRGRKAKLLKMPAGQTGPGSPWSSFEEQALIVLVHDLGPNWELISDAINNILHYKCIFRKPKECSEHHKELINRTAGDGADSAEDSGSSQPYPSTLPGIPKGSARALFQRLQEPIEDDMIKFHFEKIILMSQKQHYLRIQNENQDPKPIQPHHSHTLALSQVCPNNLNGGPALTPLDLCDTTASSPDVLSGGYQGSHASSLAMSNQGNVATFHPISGANSSLQGSSNMVLGNNFSSPSAPLNSSIRDGRYGIARSASLSIDEHQRVQHYNQMSGRNIQQSGMSVSGAPSGTDRGVRMVAGGNGMGIMCGMNRSMPMARPGFQGVATSPVLNSGTMLSSSMAVMAGPVNMHSGVGAGQGNLTLRPRESLNMIRPAQNPEHQRQMMVPDLQVQATQGNGQGVPPFGALSSGFSNQTSPPSSQTHPLHQQQHQSSPQQPHVLSNPHHPHLQGANHVSSPQHQAYAIRFAKERQLQQRLLQQQQQFAASNAILPRGQPQPQASISSSLQNSSHVQPQTSASVSVPLTQSPSSMSQHQQKLHMPPHGLMRNPQSGGSALPNQIGKQRQRQTQQQLQNSYPQPGRHHPQQRPQPQQQAKLVKGAGRGNMVMHQNLTIDPSILNGLSTTTGSHSTEKAEQVMHMMQGQGLYPGTGQNPLQHSNKPLVQQKLYPGQAIASSKQAQQLPSHLDNSNQGHAAPSTSGNTLPTSHQTVAPSAISSSNSQQLQPTQKLSNQSQLPVQRVLQQNRHMNSNSPPSKLQADEGQSEQQPVNSSSSQMGTTAAISQPSIDQVSVKSVASASGTQWKAPEQMQGSGMTKPVMQSAHVGSPPLTSSGRTDPVPSVSQGLGQGQPSVSLSNQGHITGPQRQHQMSQLQSPSSSPPPPPQEQQQQSAQQLQAGNNNLYARSTDNRL